VAQTSSPRRWTTALRHAATSEIRTAISSRSANTEAETGIRAAARQL